MNIFTDIVFIFVYVFVLLHFNIIQPEKTTIAMQKLQIFLAVFIFASILYVIKSIRKQCPINTWDAINSGLLIAMFAYIGHTLLFDFWYETGSRGFIENKIKNSSFLSLNILLLLFISFSIAIGKSVGYLFNTNYC